MDLVAHPQSGTRELARLGYAPGRRRGRAGTDGRRFADAAEGQAGRPQGRRLGPQPIPLDAGQEPSARRSSASINDVLLACVAGAIGDYLRELGEDPTGKSIRAMVPVNLRPLDEAYKLGNRFGLAPLVLPIGIAQPDRARVRRCART